jgi:phospholipase/lecithinase/hemolysin
MNWSTGGRTFALGASVTLFALTGGLTPWHAGAEPDVQPAITQAVFFGDSLTDAGTYGFRFTTMPGKTWAQHVAQRLGQSTEPNEHVAAYGDVYQGKPGIPGPGGLNYAEGGARANSAYSTVSDNPEERRSPRRCRWTASWRSTVPSLPTRS